ncbi:twin-arginine translocation signal domain-containing protein [Streptomyces sp. NA04227]|uniref:twin-arginine translocation signal domain-containing protein n=1 Tax=Streptomyces sp. NA04227 TaxID=2742136 RepID=UPI00159252F3|nr:twin-arginine translocation signal domain-containing protein [Streptomyces sp. NA04227]QKW09945.1 twin-arginine translocation signal domain-containing protein [Streptomyces sp. NA04227]
MSSHDSHGPSRRTVLRGAAVAGAAAALTPLLGASPAQAATSGSYTIRFDNGRRQTIKGLGFEIQSDSIGSGNNGLPDLVSGVPYDLTDSERTRFVQQMLKAGRSDRGFRYCRLAMGLYYRGLDSERKHMRGRYPGQTAMLADMCDQAGVEGLSVEYWSPAPAWKSNNSYIGGRIKSTEPAFLDEFSDALVADLDYLTAGGLRISQWGLQNEPVFSAPYSSCQYNATEYLAAFKAVAPKIRAKYPNVMITADSMDGWGGDIGQAILADPLALDHVDAWTYHRIGYDSNYQIDNDFRRQAQGKPVFNNEFEYLSGAVTPWRTVNTAQSIMNWMTFQDSPTWYWLHALKPTTNSESLGYSLGLWRPPHDTDFSKFGHIKAGHWDWNPANWNSVAGFVKYMPWDSVRYHVEESAVLRDQRIMAWKTTGGKPVFAITNRSATESFTYTVDTQTAASFEGHRYSPTVNDQRLTAKSGPKLTLTVPPNSIEFWVRTP